MNRSSAFMTNVLWFLLSLLVAFLVWMIATNSADPVRQRTYTTIPINMLVDNNMIVLNAESLRRTVNVNVRTRQSVIDALTRDDIVVNADLRGMAPGTHSIRLEATIARTAFADTSPVQITVELAERVSRQKPVTYSIVTEPPVGFQRGEPALSETQLLVTGPAAAVDRVARLVVPLDLDDRRDTIDDDFIPLAVNEDGDPVVGVTVDGTVRVTLEIRPLDGVQEFPVRPVINFDSVPEGYVARLVDYSPKIVTISGSPDLLARLPDSVDTDLIDLTNRTAAFTAEVRLTLPVEGLVVLNNTTINVQISIDARMGAREFDNVPVTFSGLSAGLSARAIPSRVSVLVNGPQPLLDQMTTENIAVTVDARGLRAGAYDVEPVATLNIGSVSPQDIRVLPITIGVIVSEEPHTPSPTPVVTPSSPDN